MQQVNKYFFVFSLIYFSIFSSCEDASLTETPELTAQQQLTLETQKLEQQKSALEDLKKQHSSQTQQINTSYPLQIANYTTQIQKLTDILNSLRLSEKDIDNATNIIYREQSLAIQNVRDQLDPAINNLQQSITQTQEQIYVWTNNIFPLTEQQRSLLNSLETSLTSQKQQLENLNKQKSDLSLNALNQTRLINQLAAQQKADLLENQTTTQEQIFFLRDEIERLQSAQIQQKSYLTTLNQQILQTQKDYEEQAKKVRELNEAIKK